MYQKAVESKHLFLQVHIEVHHLVLAEGVAFKKSLRMVRHRSSSDLTYSDGTTTYNIAPVLGVIFLVWLIRVGKCLTI